MDKNKLLAGIVLVGIVGNIVVLYWLLFDFKSDIETKFRQLELSAASGFSASEIVDSSNQQPVPTSPMPISRTSDCSGDCQDDIAALTVRVEKLESSPAAQKSTGATSSTQSSGSVREVFIPLGNGTFQSRDWADVPGASVYIDTSNYGTIKSAYFEASLRTPTANGTLTARLYNKTDDHPVWFSEVSMEGDKSVSKQSEKITLDSGNKLYQVQAKNTLNAVYVIDSARIKLVLQ